ncbi:periplasmic binding protein-like I [Paraphysoderma sedebokerense]|nr:periplasmic binding protein-like I [Paraphysoderma sedebokerense]
MYFVRQLLRATVLVAALYVACFPPFTAAQLQNSSRVLRICTYFTTNSSSNTFTSEFQANTGFKFWTDYVNNELGGLEINRVKYRIEQINIDHPGGNPELVADNVRKAVESQNFDFVVGGHTQYTKAVSDALNSSRPIPQIQCCTGPRSIYSAGYPNLFGLHLPSDYYTYPFLTYLKTVGVSKILLLISDQAEFTKSTGAHALKFATDATNGMKFEVLTKNYTWGATKKTELSQLASMIREGVDFGAEALISVSLTEDGKMVTRALQQVKYDFKYVYITVAPTEPNFITNETALGAQYVFSSSQWHHTMNFKDETRSFYSSKQYAEKFRSWLESQSLLGQMPTYTHASGTGAGVLLQLAMKSANSIDPKQVMAALRDFNAETFFGRIQMDRDQRNMGRDSVVVQIVNNEERSVLPTGFAGSQPESVDMGSP